MIVIDKQAESKLIRYLQEIKLQSLSRRCIHIKLSELDDKQQLQAMHHKIIYFAEPLSESQQVYLCMDGDIFILAPALSIKDAKDFIEGLPKILNIPKEIEIANFYESSNSANKLIYIVSEKIERYNNEIAEEKKQNEKKQSEIKRYAILNDDFDISKAEDISAKRKQRDKPELMLIEDDTFSRKLVEGVLRNYHLTALSTADSALLTYASLAPDVLFLDINLPDVTGHELLEKIIKMDPEAYVIMLSGYSDKHNVLEAIKKGAKGFIAKPFTPEKLFQYISKCPTIRDENHGIR